MTPAQIAADLRAAIGDVQDVLNGVDDTRTTHRPRPGGWCAREVLGHLIDSACNNHRRFVVGQSPSTHQFDGYNQNEWVARQQYEAVPWSDLVLLWTAYNRHLAHVIECTPEAAAALTALAPDGSGQASVAYLMEDYVVDLRHHLTQIRHLLA
jgi:hypothetical protein